MSFNSLKESVQFCLDDSKIKLPCEIVDFKFRTNEYKYLQKDAEKDIVCIKSHIKSRLSESNFLVFIYDFGFPTLMSSIYKKRENYIEMDDDLNLCLIEDEYLSTLKENEYFSLYRSEFLLSDAYFFFGNVRDPNLRIPFSNWLTTGDIDYEWIDEFAKDYGVFSSQGELRSVADDKNLPLKLNNFITCISKLEEIVFYKKSL